MSKLNMYSELSLIWCVQLHCNEIFSTANICLWLCGVCFYGPRLYILHFTFSNMHSREVFRKGKNKNFKFQESFLSCVKNYQEFQKSEKDNYCSCKSACTFLLYLHKKCNPHVKLQSLLIFRSHYYSIYMINCNLLLFCAIFSKNGFCLKITVFHFFLALLNGEFIF